MGCDRCREVLSARLDGEDDTRDRLPADEHLAGCADCRAWYETAVAVNRLARTGLPTTPPGVGDEVLAALPGPGRARWTTGLRTALGLLGAVQFVLGAVQMTGFAGADHGHAWLGLAAPPDHLWHESAAWNVAVGAGFGWVALRRSRPSGVLPMLTAFVAVLTLLSVNDVLAGRVETARLLSHGFVLAGYAIVLVLSLFVVDLGDPPARRGLSGPRWRARFDDADPAPVRAAPPARLVRQLRPGGQEGSRRAA